MRKVCPSLPPTLYCYLFHLILSLWEMVPVCNYLWSYCIRISQTVHYRWKLIREQYQVEKGLLPVSPRRLVVVSSWQPLSLQCSKPTVEGTRQRLPHTNNRLGKSTFISWLRFAEHYLPVCLHCLSKPWIGQFYQMMLTCTAVCVWLCFMYVHSCPVIVWAQWKSTQFYNKFFVWLTSSSNLNASSCRRSCRVRRGKEG